MKIVDCGYDPVYGARPLKRFLQHKVETQDDDGIFEIDCPALRIGDPSVVQYLKQDVEHIRMRLLDLIEQDDRIWMKLYSTSR